MRRFLLVVVGNGLTKKFFFPGRGAEVPRCRGAEVSWHQKRVEVIGVRGYECLSEELYMVCSFVFS